MGRQRGATTAFITTALAAALLLSGCVGASGPAPTASSTPSPTPTVTPSPTLPAPTFTSSPSPSEAPPPEPTHAPEPEPTPTSAPGTANVVIANSRYDAATRALSVAAMITDVVSSGGTCTLTAVQGDVSLAAQAAGQPDASVTYCGDLTVVLPEGAAGSWTATVAYADESRSGSVSSEVVAQ